MRTKGFTLLELLIVISIIGLLAMITFDYLGSSRDKGADSATKQNLINSRSLAELYFTNNATYEGLCNAAAPGIFANMRAATVAQNITPQAVYADNSPGTIAREACHDSATAYAAWVPLKEGGGICIDSQNTTVITTTPLPATPIANRFVCPS